MSILNKLPSNWNLITINQYQELRELGEEELSGTSLVLEQLAVLLDTDTEDPELDDLTIDELFEAIEKLQFLSADPPANSTKIDIDYEPIEFKDLSLGEFIDLEHFMTDPIGNVKIILSIIFKKTGVDEWFNKTYEPYIYDINNRAEEFGDIPVTVGMYWIKKYRTWKEEFIKIHENLFEDPDTGKEVEEENEELSGLDKIKLQQELKLQQNMSKFSWERTIYGLANGDITKFSEVFSQKLILVFNVLGMKRTFDV